MNRNHSSQSAPFDFARFKPTQMAIEALPNAKQYTDFVYSAYQTRHVQINTRIRMADERYQIAKYNQQSDTSFAYRVKRYTVYSKRQDSLKRKSTLVE